MKRAFLFVLLCQIGISAFSQSVNAVLPTVGGQGSSLTLKISGTGLNATNVSGFLLQRPGSPDIFSTGLPTVINNSQLNADFTLPGNADLGIYDVNYWLDQPTNITPGLTESFNIVNGPGGQNGYISGRISRDFNSNCQIDGSDFGLSQRVVEINPGPWYAITDAQGYFGIWMPLGSYTLTTNAQQNESLVCPSQFLSVNLTVQGDTVPANDFFIHFPPFRDVSVRCYLGMTRPGFSQTHVLRIQNRGDLPEPSGTAAFVFDSILSFSSSNPTQHILNNDTVLWFFSNLQPNEVRQFFITTYCPPPPQVNIGTQISGMGIITLPQPDPFPANDIAITNILTRGAYDPNDKQVWTESGDNADGYIDPSDSLLEYMIRFQNTGTDTAFNIFIMDTLAPELDIATLQTTFASHDYSMELYSDGTVKWMFDNVLLPDSNVNEPGSHGFIRYQIKLDAGLPEGTLIPNTAHIYFDFNPPIVTNTVISEICARTLTGITYTTTGLNVDFTDPNAANHVSWLWDFGGGITSTLQNPSHLYPNPGVYIVCLYTENSCGRIDSLCQNVYVGVVGNPERAQEYVLKVWPNPNQGILHVDLEMNGTEKVEMSLYSAQGARIWEAEEQSRSDLYQEEIDLSGYAKGLYFLKVRVGDMQRIEKVILE